LLSCSLPGMAAEEICGRLIKTSAGPHDYRFASETLLNVVERVHFTPGIEKLTAKPPQYLAQDLSYTLNKFPNHYRALDAISRLSVKVGEPHPRGSDYSVDCWFQRAVVFQPKDAVVRLTYAIHLERLGKYQEALKHTEAGLRLDPKNAKILYYAARFNLRLGNADEARRYALDAQAAGFPIDDLREELIALGHWND
jgi:tetratricopeptide (TPR) repeat protein